MANLDKFKEAARKFEQKEQWAKAVEQYVKAIEVFEAEPEIDEGELGLSKERGRLAVGCRADLVVWNCKDVRELCYWYGMPLAWRTFVAGRPWPA